jgi:signal transduction histidine kinase
VAAVYGGGLEQSRRDLIRTSQLAVAGELVGAITHDLRQPLTALHVNLEVATQSLRQTPPQVALALAALDDAADDSRKLRDSVQVLHSLVARREPIRTGVALDAVVMEVARLVQSEADARRVQLTVALARQLPPLSADASMLREAVLSIVLDAIENAAPEIGAAPVRVDTKQLDDQQVELAVTHRRRPEATEDNAWALRVARSVAEAHGATVAVETTPASEVLVRTIWPTGPSFVGGPAAM